MNLAETKYRALKLSAYLEAFEQSLDKALEVLGDSEDADSIRRRVKVLLDLDRPAEAVELVAERTIERTWIEGAMRAAVRADSPALISSLWNWSKSENDPTLLKKLAFITAYETLDTISTHKVSNLVVNPDALSREQKTRLSSAFDLATEIIGNPISYFPTTRLDEYLISAAYQIALYLGKMSDTQNLAMAASKIKPLNVFLGQHASAGIITPDLEWPDRYRKEWGDDLEANIVAAILDAKFYNKGRGAFSSLVQMVGSLVDKDKRERLFIGLHELAGLLGPQEEKLVESLVSELLEPGSRFSDFTIAESHLKRGETALAAPFLEKWADPKDPLWVQLQVGFLIEKDDSEAALRLLDECVRDIVSPLLLSQVADLAFKVERWDVAERALKRFVGLKPNNVTAYKNLSAIYVRASDYAKARETYLQIAKLEPDNIEVKVDIAACLMEEGDLDGALIAANAIIAMPDGKSLRLLLLKANIQKLLGQNEAAFKMLGAEKALYWDLPEFLFAYQEACYRAGHDEEAHEAFQKLLDLRSSGRLPEGVIQAKTVDELLEYSKSYREHISKLTQQVLVGKMPWIGVAIAERSPILWHWALKTQPLPWIPEAPENVAEFSLYATNGYEVVVSGTVPTFRKIEAAPQGTPITIDYSALISLSRLGLMDKALDHYQEIAVASLLVEQAVRERERLLPHQFSQVEAWATIRQLILDKRIDLVTSENASDNVYVAEYGKNDADVTLKTLVDSFVQHNLVTTTLRDRLLKVAHKPAKAGISIALDAKLNIEIGTLKTLFSVGVLDILVSNYKVGVAESGLDEMNRDLRAYDLQAKVYRWHDELWKQVRTDSRFKVTPVAHLDKPQEDHGADLFTAPFQLAYESGKVLLTDDRAVQQWAGGIDRLAHGRAFGTDCLLEAFLHRGVLSVSQTADAYLSLMKWRYRFLCPHWKVLLEYVSRYSGATPGTDLELVARYVHDCMRDPGLYGGNEQTVPPMSMALRFYLDWSSTYGVFLGAVWGDKQFAPERAEAITRWVCETALPAPPRVTDLRVLPDTSEHGKKMFLGQLGMSLGGKADPAQAERALRMAATLCNVNEDKLFLFLTGEVLP